MAFLKTLAEAARALDKIHSNVSGWYGLLIDDLPLTYNIGLLNQNTNTFTCTVTSTDRAFKNGCKVRFTSTGTMPTGLLTGVNYYVIDSNLSGLQNTFKVSTLANFNFDDLTGVPVDYTSSGSGTLSITQQPLGREDRFELWAQQESQYQGSGRQSITIPPLTKDWVNIQAKMGPIILNYVPTTASITHRYFAVICEGSSSAGDSSGTLVGYEDYTTVQTITTSGKSFVYNITL